jgi:hypothetical protein
VNQCSGNSRGFFQPRVQGGQLGHGAMGCARWRGVRLADVLKAAGLDASAKQVVFNGLDTPFLPATPDFLKAIDTDQALDPELLLAFEQNGEPLPWLNGFPLRLVVPGHYGTYWIKHLHEITVTDAEFKGFFMNPGYRIPDDPCAAIEPGTTPKRTVPISRFNVRSFITSVEAGARLKAGVQTLIRGIAFDDGHGIREVVFSADGGRSWRAAELGKPVDKFAFRHFRPCRLSSDSSSPASPCAASSRPSACSPPRSPKSRSSPRRTPSPPTPGSCPRASPPSAPAPTPTS